MLAFPKRMSFKIIQMENNHLRNEYSNRGKGQVSCHCEINNAPPTPSPPPPPIITVIVAYRGLEREYFCSITARN